MPPIAGFFYNQTRTGAFLTEATNTFRYAPATSPVAQAVVDEAERLAAVQANAAGRGAVEAQLGRKWAMANPPRPSPRPNRFIPVGRSARVLSRATASAPETRNRSAVHGRSRRWNGWSRS